MCSSILIKIGKLKLIVATSYSIFRWTPEPVVLNKFTSPYNVRLVG